jgi:hypothetical protein
MLTTPNVVLLVARQGDPSVIASVATGQGARCIQLSVLSVGRNVRYPSSLARAGPSIVANVIARTGWRLSGSWVMTQRIGAGCEASPKSQGNTPSPLLLPFSARPISSCTAKQPVNLLHKLHCGRDAYSARSSRRSRVYLAQNAVYHNPGNARHEFKAHVFEVTPFQNL